MITEESFAKEVAFHAMTVEQDNGVFRSLKFASTGPHPCFNWFRIVTWPGCLCISGDCGTFVFERTHDMFKFFRGNKPDPGYYWKQKVIAVDRSSGLTCFDPDSFKSTVKEIFEEWMESAPLAQEQRDQLWTEIEDDVLGAEDSREAHERLRDFEFEIDGHTFEFTDSWEYDFEKPSERFVWNCLAIEWAIKKYDDAKEPIT